MDDEIVQELEFSNSWIDLGIISPQVIEQLKLEWEKGEDPHPEHYRWRVFQRFLADHEALGFEMMQALYKLGEEDPDFATGRAMVFAVVERSDCPTELLERSIRSGHEAVAKLALAKIEKRTKAE